VSAFVYFSYMSPKQILLQWIDAFNNVDIDTLSNLYADDAINHQVANEPIVGKAAIRKMFDEEFARAKMVCVPENIFEDGDWAIMEWKDPLGLRGCGFFKIQNDKIVFQRGYWDKLSFLQIHGLNNAPTLGNGKICYVEMPSRNVDESARFYNKVFGWKSRTRGDGSIAFDDTVGQVSGSWRTDRKPFTDVGTLVYIMVDEIRHTMQLIIENGGKIVQDVGGDHPEITARFTDPTGNIFGLYQEPT